MRPDSGIVWRKPGKPRVQSTGAFLPLMRAAVAAHPDDHDLLLDLVIALRDANQGREIVERLALRADGLPPELAVELGVAWNRCGESVFAREILERVIAGAPDQVLRDPAARIAALQSASVELSSLLAASGQHEAALRVATDALDRNPRDDAAFSMVANLMLTQGNAAALIALLDDGERQGVQSTLRLSCRANALGALGAHKELEQMVSPAQWCAQTMIDPDLVDNQRLAEVILNHPALQVSHGDRPTQGANRRLDAVASRDESELRAIVSAIRGRLDAYAAARRDISHPLMSQMPGAAVLQGWALATSGDGHEARHIHPRSWITAVYYVRVPKMKRDGEEPPPGSIIFGPWPADTQPCANRFPAWHFVPREGMLLIFPSFMAHSTVPAGVDELRLCVTLDVMPMGTPDA